MDNKEIEIQIFFYVKKTITLNPNKELTFYNSIFLKNWLKSLFYILLPNIETFSV